MSPPMPNPLSRLIDANSARCFYHFVGRCLKDFDIFYLYIIPGNVTQVEISLGNERLNIVAS